MNEPLAVDIREAARLSSCSRSTIYSEISLGNLAIHKIGRRTVISMENLRAWLATKADEVA
jgi:excisionase family DNA binding protein